MDIRHITDDYAVSPQIAPEDAAEIAAAGFTVVICNRPDPEVPPFLQSDAVRTAVETAGLAFHFMPITHDGLTPERIALQRKVIEDAGGPVLAYCASGTRSSVIWALGQASERPAEDILEATRRAGYALDALRPRLTADL